MLRNALEHICIIPVAHTILYMQANIFTPDSTWYLRTGKLKTSGFSLILGELPSARNVLRVTLKTWLKHSKLFIFFFPKIYQPL